MPFTYAVFGVGRQGTAAAYDMGRWGRRPGNQRQHWWN